MKRSKTRKLSDQEWLFCHEYLTRGDLIRSVTVAYPKIATRTVAHRNWVAKRILSRPVVAAELERMRNEIRSSHRLTLDQHMTILADIRDEARGAEQFAAAARCEELRGRVAGFYFEQHIHVHDQPQTRDEIRMRLQALLEKHPQLKDALGIEAEEPKSVESTVHQPESSVPALADDQSGQ